MTRGRLTAQIQNDQLDLFRLQNQLSTGFRIFLPSDDASSAQRAMVLQRTIERKDQSVTNLQGARASLVTTESSLSGLNETLNGLKSAALGVVDTVASDGERQTLIDSINGALFELTRVGNATFVSNYLLGGAERSSQAYTQTENYVEYLGDESSPQTFIDIGQLFDQGLSGSDVLGGIASAVYGSNDLNVQLTPETKLSRLNSGAGANSSGSVEIAYVPTLPSDPTTTSTIDLSQAESIEDVVRLIEAGAPEGADIVVSIEDNALRLDVADGGITVGEVGGGSVARELGILSVGVPSPTISGADLDPTLRGTTRLEDLVGSKARGRIEAPGDNNDLQITAKANGDDFNGLTVLFEGGASVGAESAVMTGANELTVTIADGITTAERIAEVINANASLPVTAETDYRDQTTSLLQGTGAVSVPSTPGTNLAVGFRGGVDGELDLAAGLLITNGDEAFEIDTSGAETVEDLLGILNDPEYGLLASVNSAGDGIDVRTRRSGADFAIGENGGTTAEQLGIRTYTESSRLDNFNRGVGVLVEGENPADALAQNAFRISVTEDGVTQEYTIDPREALTVDDLIRQIALDTGGAIEATLATEGNGLVLTATDPDSPATVAQGSVAVPTDTASFSETFTLTANEAGNDGNRQFTLVVDGASGSSGVLATSVDGNVITVDLGGTTPTTASIAASIEGELAGFSVTFGGDGTDTVSADLLSTSAETLGGAPASAAALASNGSFTLNSDTIDFTADATGPEGNRPFSVVLVDDGVGGLATSIDGDSITVDLGGADSTTDAIAARIQTAINDARDAAIADGEEAGPTFTVQSNGNAAVTAFATSSSAATTGGDGLTVATGSFTLNSQTIDFTADAIGPEGNRPFEVALVDDGVGGLATTIDGDSITVDLGGADSTTDDIAASIQAAINAARDAALAAGEEVGPTFTVQASGNAAVDAFAASFSAATTGGRAIDSIEVSGEYAERLGFIPTGEDSVLVEDGMITSTDRNAREVDSVFTTLIRMRDALESGDQEGFEREVERMNDDIDRVSFARAEVGVRLQNLDAVSNRLADEEVTLREALSNEIDADLIEVISEFTAKQAALQASLQTSGALLGLTILDFI